MMRNLRISISFPAKNMMMPILLKSLLPETQSPTTSRSKVTIKSVKQSLLIEIKAKDLIALRATFNSYLRWVALIVDIYRVLDPLEISNEKTLN
jgi:tRNA threonylcarbamoyladenosine modification (KEOPS) complex  Pcc1 subunit